LENPDDAHITSDLISAVFIVLLFEILGIGHLHNILSWVEWQLRWKFWAF